MGRGRRRSAGTRRGVPRSVRARAQPDPAAAVGRRRRLDPARLGGRDDPRARRAGACCCCSPRSRPRPRSTRRARGGCSTASFVETGDAAFALHPQTGDLYLRILRGLDGLDYEEFEDLVHSIAKTADHWDDKLALSSAPSCHGDCAPATARVGARLAALVRGGDAIALVGDLGAGKTTLVDRAGRGARRRRGGEPDVLARQRVSGRPARRLARRSLPDRARGRAPRARARRRDRRPARHLRRRVGRSVRRAAGRSPADRARATTGGGRTVTATGTGPRGRELAAELLGSSRSH